MIVYNFAAEFASLVIILAVLLSFSRDYDAQTVQYRFLKFTYGVSFVSVLTTIVALLSGIPGSNMTLARVSNVIYFMVIPSGSLCYLIYAKLITAMKFDLPGYRKKLLPTLIPYGVYLLILIVGMACGKVFHVTQDEGYVRGDWFQLPYIIVTVNILWVVVTVCRHAKALHRDIIKTMLSTAVLAFAILLIQYHSPNTIMTGTLYTMSILGLHLYAQNVRKSTDQLTGIYNRMALVHTLNQHVHHNEGFSLYVFSLRGMKTINARYGIDFGDRILMHTAQTFVRCAGDSSVFRYDGDEFALLLPNHGKNHQQLLEHLVSQLDAPVVMDGNELNVELVYTRVDYSLFGNNVQDLLSAADYSLSILKRHSAGERYLYDPTVASALLQRNNTVELLKDAIAHNRIVMHYQPIYSVDDNCFTQAEALMRISREDGSLIYPGDFITLAVKTGLIVPMTYLILEQVCADLRHLLDTYGADLRLTSVSVNFPYLQFTDPKMPEKVNAILDKYAIPCHMIKIEITEREMVADTARTKAIMQDMIAQGYAFELDDFGMDYSNLSVVLDLPLDSVKLDRSLLLAAFEKAENATFFRHMVTAVSALGCMIISEGVEEQAQCDFIQDCGCDYIQGYHFSKPLPLSQFETVLTHASAAHSAHTDTATL